MYSVITKWKIQLNWYTLKAEICDNPWFRPTNIITCVPTQKWNVFTVEHILYTCTKTWKSKLYDVYIKHNFNLAPTDWRVLYSSALHWYWVWVEIFSRCSSSRTTTTRVKKITGLGNVLSCIKSSTYHTFSSMKCQFYAGTLVCGALQNICQEISLHTLNKDVHCSNVY